MKYGRMFHQVIDGLSASAIVELMFYKVPTTCVMIIHNIKITQDTIESSEQLPLNIFKTATDQSAKGNAGTVTQVQTGDAAHGGTARENILAAATLATETTMIWRESQNILNGWDFVPLESDRPVISPGGMVVVKVDAAPAAATSFSGVMVFELIGG